MYNGWIIEFEISQKTHISDTHFPACAPKHPCTGRILEAAHWISDANRLHILKTLNQDRILTRGFLSKIRISHTKDRHLLGAFGYFMSEKMDILEKEKSNGQTMHKYVNTKLKIKPAMSEEHCYLI